MEFTEGQALYLAIGSLGLGIIMLIRGGGWTIDASVYLARHFGISPLVVGFTVVAFGTSLPELIVSVNANLKGSIGIALGNVLGSNIANVLLVIGATAFFSTLVAKPKALLNDLIFMLLSSGLLAGLLLYGEISRISGLLMMLVLLVYVFWKYKRAMTGDALVQEVEEPKYKNMKTAFFFLVCGLVIIAFGAEFLVRGAQVSARIIGVPESVIGLSVIAIGTSLPELSTCLIAAMKKHGDIVLGNIIGSNVFNILMIIGATSFIKAVPAENIAPELVQVDIWVVLLTSLVFAGLLLFYKKITRPIGLLFLIAYMAYMGLIFSLYMHDLKLPL